MDECDGLENRRCMKASKGSNPLFSLSESWLSGLKQVERRMILVKEWKPIEGYEGNYEISNYGSVRNVISGRELKALPLRKGYLSVNLSKNGKVKRFTIHRLVAKHFLYVTDPDSMVVNHINGNKQDNNLGNLEWTTIKMNTIHAVETGLFKIKGVDNPMSKLSEQDILDIRTLYKKGYYLREIAPQFNVSEVTISNVVNYKTYN